MSADAPPLDDFHSHLGPGRKVPAQLHLGMVALADGVQELLMAKMGLLVGRVAASSWVMVTC